jgi:D-tyrosyl-tRNA(Tyr) deacylase
MRIRATHGHTVYGGRGATVRALLQRVTSAEVRVEGAVTGSCGAGLCVLLGVGNEDTAEVCDRLWRKVRDLRIFADAAGKTNLSVKDVGGELLVVSQFTLYADCRRGNRPSFTDAARPDLAIPLYERFVADARSDGFHVGCGVFGADMQVSIENDGPFTVMLEM